MKVTRHICKEKLRIKHFSRTPTDIIDSAEIKAECKFCYSIFRFDELYIISSNSSSVFKLWKFEVFLWEFIIHQ